MFKGLMARAAGLSLTGRAAWALIGVMAAALAWAGWTQWRIGNLHEQVGHCQGGVAAVAQVATNNATAVEDCSRRLKQEIASRLAAEDAERLANQRLETETEFRRDLAERERAARQEAYRDPDCNEWGVALACPDVADSLRRAASAGREDRGNSDPGDPEDS